ncbi:MAG: phospholipase A [Cycloclasticus sp.]|nr:phospholipase A [Cycloclasticus sp.]
MAESSAIFFCPYDDHHMKYRLLILLFLSSSAMGERLFDMEKCLTMALDTANDEITVGELKHQCSETINNEPTTMNPPTNHLSAIKQRQLYEKHGTWNAFSLLPHKPNYIMLGYNTSEPNHEPYKQEFSDQRADLQHLETKFQISMKLPVVQGVFNGYGDLYAGYTNRSFWQQFNKTNSSPFRDTNHEAESWLSFDTDYDLAGLHNSVIRTGFTHQSNGQSGSLSRSWNRVYTDFILERGDVYLSFKPWFRISESSSNDDNPDIEDFLGNFELRGLYKKQQHSFDFMFRNNLKTGSNRGAIELGWSFPIHKKVRGYVQWFNGYGESMLDYDNHTNSIGFGIQLSDWL